MTKKNFKKVFIKSQIKKKEISTLFFYQIRKLIFFNLKMAWG
jgi:hypothetical protein